MSLHVAPRAWLLLAASVLASACGSTAADVPVDVPAAPRVPERLVVAREVGRLLGPDPEVSEAAAARLMALDGEARERFLAYAATLEGERDLRLLNVLDEQHALPDLPVQERLDFLLWKATQPERFYAMKAQSRLLDLAREQPDALIARLEAGGREAEILAVALAVSDTKRAVPALLRRYRTAPTDRGCAAAAEALGILAGEERRPRTAGRPEEIEADAEAVAVWYRDLRERAAERSAVPPPPPTGETR